MASTAATRWGATGLSFFTSSETSDMQFPSKTLILRIATFLAGPALVMACAQIPKSNVAESQFASLSCTELAREVAVAQATRAAAEQARSESWHAVLPFVVAARYVDAGATSSEAERRITLLSAQAAQRPCAS